MTVATIETATRSSWSVDMPAGLTEPERLHYVKGYSRGVSLYTRKNGGASVSSDGPSPAPGTAARTMLARQLAGMREEHAGARHVPGMSPERDRMSPGANRPCADCGVSVTLELTGTWRAPFYVPCAATGAVGHRPEVTG